MSALKDDLATVWAADLTARLPEGHTVYASRRKGTVRPPFSVLVIRRLALTTPGSNVWEAEGRLVVVCDKEGEGSTQQKQRLAEALAALEATDVPCEDLNSGVRLYGVAVESVEQARAEKVYSDVIMFVAGVGPTL